jgi:hypothetical protein
MFVVGGTPLSAEGGDRLQRGTVQQGVDHVVVVLSFEVSHLHGGAAVSGVNGDAARSYGGRPEETGVFIYSGIEVVNLTRFIEDIESGEDEGAMMVLSIHTDVLALHEA